MFDSRTLELSPIDSQLNLFFVENATSESARYKSFIEYVDKSWDDAFRHVTFGFIVSDTANAESIKLAQDLSTKLIAHGASGCYYIRNEGVVMKDLCGTYENFEVLFQEELKPGGNLSVIPAPGQFIELPDLSINRCPWKRFDSVFIEDTQHCSTKAALDYPIVAPSPFDARQNKKREMVIFNPNQIYTQYAILVYQYESEEAMQANKCNEYPHDRHCIPLGKNGDPLPLYFFGRNLYGPKEVEGVLIVEDTPPFDEKTEEEKEHKK